MGTEGHYQDMSTYDGTQCKLCHPVCTLGVKSDLTATQVRDSVGCPVDGVDEIGSVITDCIQNQNDRRTCPGNTYEDTQDKCQDRCDLNYYKDRDTDTCRPCELCEY